MQRAVQFRFNTENKPKAHRKGEIKYVFCEFTA